MDDNKSKSSWGHLADELGAKPSSEAFERSQPPETEIPTSEDPSTFDEPQQVASDWNALASDLGLEVPKTSASEETPEPVAEEAIVEPETPSASASEPPRATSGFGAGLIDEATDDETENAITDVVADEATDSAVEALPPLPSEVDQIMSEGDWEDTLDSDGESESDESDDDEQAEADNGMSGEAARNAFDALFTAGGSAVAFPPPEHGQEQPSFEAEDSADSLASTDETQEKTSEDEERPKRKRSRRRRRGRGGRKSETEQTTGEEAPVEEAAIEGAAGEGAAGGESEDNGTDEAPSDEEKKPRRRRSRRRSRRSENSEDPVKRTDVEEAEGSDDEVSESCESSGRDSTGHRNMPTWSEALSVIVEANIENHSKTPSSSGSSRGRGRGRSGGGGRRGQKKT